MKKTILTLAVAAAGTMISSAALADFCGNYASSMVNINTQAARLGCNLTHPNWQHHYNWCVRNPPGRVNGALQSWQGRLNQCRPRQGGGGCGGGGGGGGGYGGGGYGGGGGGGYGGGRREGGGGYGGGRREGGGYGGGDSGGGYGGRREGGYGGGQDGNFRSPYGSGPRGGRREGGYGGGRQDGGYGGGRDDE